MMAEEQLSFPTERPADFTPTPAEGLTDAQADRLRAEGHGNNAQEDPGKSVLQIVLENLFTLFNLLNFALAACLIAVGSWRNLLFMGVVVSNTLIGTVQELRARATLKRLQLLNQPNVRVRRGGEVCTLASEALVQGDRVLLEAGNQVPADAIVLSGAGGANESMLTGESDTVEKAPGAWLMSGSYIVEGQFEAQLVHVGADSYISRLSSAAHKIKRPKSALMTDLNKLVRFVSIILVPLGLLLFSKQFFLQHMALNQAVPSAAAAMIGMIPEGLMLLTSLALTVGVIRLGKRKTLVQELYGIETLARADVLCLDKTGTITTGDMALDSILYADASEEEVRFAMSRFMAAFDTNTATMTALRAAFPPAKETPVALIPFSSAIKKSAATFADGVTYVMGAPTFVLDERIYTPDLKATVKQAASEGKRVMVLAQCAGEIKDGQLPPVSRVLAFLCLTDMIRSNAAETLAFFKERGVSVRIISGDDPVTVSAIGRRICLDGAENYADATTLKDDAALAEAAGRCVVFGRVTPDQKRRLVEALKAQGHSVAMTGDGVNDIPALKAADCSIAMAGGSDAAKHAAQLTLLNPDFACLPAVVGEGRRVVNNVTRAASLFLVKTLYSFALSVLLLFLPAAYPFQPIQLTVISTLTIGVPSFFLALEPNQDPIRGKFLRTVLQCAVPGALSVAICATISMLMSLAGWAPEVCSTLATVSAGAMGLLVLFQVCRPFSPLRTALISAMALGMVIAFTLFGSICFLVPLTGGQWAMLAALIAGGAVVQILANAVLRRAALRDAGQAAQG